MSEEKRGRPSKEDVEPSVDSFTIRDESLEPFFIVKDSRNYTVYEVSVSKRGFAGKKPSGKKKENVVGYYTNLKYALKSIAKEKFLSKSKDYESLKSYLDEWSRVESNINLMLKKVEL